MCSRGARLGKCYVLTIQKGILQESVLTIWESVLTIGKVLLLFGKCSYYRIPESVPFLLYYCVPESVIPLAESVI